MQELLVIGMVNSIYVFLLLCIFTAIFCLEILINLQIYLVFVQISLCIL